MPRAPRGYSNVIRVVSTRRGINQITAKLEPEVLFRKARASLEDYLKELVRSLQRNTPWDTGEASRGYRSQINGETLADLNGIVFNTAKYFPALEYGRRAGRRLPPSAPIEVWAGRHGIEPRAVFAIRRAIGERGIPALHLMRSALQLSRHRVGTVWFNKFLEDWGRGGRQVDR